MEIIFYRYGSICEPDIIDAFKVCGVTVIEETTEIHQKSIAPKTRIRILSELLLTHKASFVFSINFFPYISEICERLNVLYVALSVDCPVLELFSLSIRNKCNRIFLFDYMQYQRFHDENPDCIFYLPLGVNASRWEQAIADATEKDREQYSCDISFVGSLYNEKSPLPHLMLDEFHKGYADGLINAQLKIMGYNFLEDACPSSLVDAIRRADPSFHQLPGSFSNTDAYVAANYYLGMEASSRERIDTLKGLGNDFPIELYTRSDCSFLKDIAGIHCRGGVSTHKEMPLVFHFSKINLNITIRSIQSGLSQRIWDVLGCEGFLLSNYQNEIPEYLEIGEDLDCYESLPELKEKAAYYLAHEDVRRSIAENGCKKVRQHHTYIHRIYQILQVIYPQMRK